MCRSRFDAVWLLPAVIALLAGCELDPQRYRYGENITGLQFEYFDETEGVHPSQVVLLNPNNPFVEAPIGAETKFDLLTGGGNAAGFYAWATLLATGANGENQFYAATKLRDVYYANEVPPEDSEKVRLLAIAAFQSVLDNFPDSVTFDASGTIPFPLATPAFQAIVDLNGRPEGDWALVQDVNGNPVAVKRAGVDIPRTVVEEEDDS
ncbi:MAG: hypothetical protein RMA76_03650 [Deltaproteobacteria bacterium]|jgi:hypothetical protein